jgi:hypothetical protein
MPAPPPPEKIAPVVFLNEKKDEAKDADNGRAKYILPATTVISF